MALSLWELITFVGLGLLLVITSMPLVKRKVEPNLGYGFCTEKTMSNPDIWYPANEYAGRISVRCGYFLIAFAVTLFLVPGIDGPTYAVANAVAMLVSMFVLLAFSFRYLKKL